MHFPDIYFAPFFQFFNKKRLTKFFVFFTKNMGNTCIFYIFQVIYFEHNEVCCTGLTRLLASVFQTVSGEEKSGIIIRTPSLENKQEDVKYKTKFDNSTTTTKHIPSTKTIPGHCPPESRHCCTTEARTSCPCSEYSRHCCLSDTRHCPDRHCSPCRQA